MKNGRKKPSIVFIAVYDQDSLSVRTLQTVIEKQQYEVNSIFIKQSFELFGSISEIKAEEYDMLLDLLKDVKPDVIGISVRSAVLFPLAAQITRRIKEASDAHVIWGGIYPTLCPEESLEYADMVCVGEGEETILELMDRINKEMDFSDIDNLCLKKGGNIVKNRLRPVIQDLDSIPFPDFSDNNKYYITGSRLYRSRPRPRIQYDILAGRGCIFGCTYCSTTEAKKLYSNEVNYVRRRSVENVIDELSAAVSNSGEIKKVLFYDGIFIRDKNWLEEFCSKYKEKVGLPFFGYPHPLKTDDEMLAILKNAGLNVLRVGFQSGSDRIRNEIYNRPESKTDVIELGKLINKHKIPVSYDIIIDNPLETEEEMFESLDLLLSLPKPFLVNVHRLCYYPKSEINEKVKGIDESDKRKRRKNIFPLDVKDDKYQMFWCSIYYLAGRRYIPNKIICLFSKSRLLRKNPYILAFTIDRLYRMYFYILVIFNRQQG
ncbi:B12-binding domain-containing radical SAM protein [Elusimicrobiota bacterium]